jgi:hypothetical protein
MTTIRRTSLMASLLLGMVGTASLASGQYNNRRTNPPPPPRVYVAPPRPQPNNAPHAYVPPPRSQPNNAPHAYVPPPRSQPNNASHVNTPPPTNTPQQVHQPPLAAGPNPTTNYAAHPTTNTPVAGAGSIGTARSDSGRVGTTPNSVHGPTLSDPHMTTPSALGTNHTATPTVHPPAVTAKSTLPVRPAYTLPANSRTPQNLGAPQKLDNSASKSVVQQVNTARSSMGGINSRPLPQGNVTVHPNGALTIEGSGGRQYHVRQDGTVAGFESHGVKANFRPDGTISAVHTPNMNINYAANGVRRVETVRPDHSALVSTGPHHGYLQRTVVVNNRTVVQRTYVVNNTTYVRAYSTYAYRGVVLEHFVPAVYYAPAFYGWVYYPWPRAVVYPWGFYSATWYVNGGGYFTPAPVYPTPTLWLTDYSLAQTLGNAYQDRPATAAPAGGIAAQSTTPISPETKQLLAAEVQEIVAAENKAASDPNPESNIAGDLPDLVKHKRSVYVVASNLDVTSESGECGLTPGDIVEMEAPLPQDALTADVRVMSSKRMDCPVSSMISVSLEQLQEMHNDLRQKVDEGMKVLQAGQGSGVIPAAPSDAIAPPPRPSYLADMAPVSGEQVAAMIANQQQVANATPKVIQDEFGA